MLVPLGVARRRIDAEPWPSPGRLKVPTLASVGRLAAESMRAPGPLPPWRISAMDGYAVRLDGVNDGPLRVRGASFPAEGRARSSLRAGEASYVTTGAALPKGADAVARIEATRREGNLLRLASVLRPGQDIIEPGETMRSGERLLDAGEPITAAHLGALIAQRIRVVPVHRLRVTILPVGDELAADGGAGRGRTPESIGPMIERSLGFAEVDRRDPLPDDRGTVAKELGRAARTSDLVVTIGGSSVGSKDVTKAAIASLGSLLFEGVTANVLKRGAVGRVRGTPVVVLPGQPVSAVTVLHEHGLHVLSRMVGRELRAYVDAALGEALTVRHRMDTTMLFRIEGGRAVPLPWGVARLTSLLEADAFGVLARGRRHAKGSRLRLQRLWTVR